VWVFTEGAYLSIVRHRDSERLLLVRARERRSLEDFCSGAEVDEALIEATPAADYPFRVACPDQAVTKFLAGAVAAIRYDNLKNAAGQRRGDRWHDVLLRIWATSRTLPTGDP
jgi:hypothetical protein